MSVSFSAGTGLLIIGIFFLLLIIPGFTDIIGDLFSRQIRSVWRKGTKYALAISGLFLVVIGLIVILKTDVPTNIPAPTPTIVLVQPTIAPVLDPNNSYLPATSLSTNNGVINNATAIPSSSSQPQSIEVTFKNPGTSFIHLTVKGDQGFWLEIDIPPGTSQTVSIPSGNYRYDFYEEGVLYNNPPHGSFSVDVKQELCISSFTLGACPSNP